LQKVERDALAGEQCDGRRPHADQQRAGLDPPALSGDRLEAGVAIELGVHAPDNR